eukprot:1161396-Pelagomonas_calceolata.AAC.7
MSYTILVHSGEWPKGSISCAGLDGNVSAMQNIRGLPGGMQIVAKTKNKKGTKTQALNQEVCKLSPKRKQITRRYANRHKNQGQKRHKNASTLPGGMQIVAKTKNKKGTKTQAHYQEVC